MPKAHSWHLPMNSVPTRILRTIALLGALLLCAQLGRAAPLFRLTELSNPAFFSDRLRVDVDGSPRLANFSLGAGGVTYAADVNSQGEVAGACGGPTGSSIFACAYRLSSGLQALPFLRPPFPSYATDAYDINERGDVIGGTTSVNAGNANLDLQIILSTGEFVDLGISSYRRPSINNALHVVGAGLQEGTAFYYDGAVVSLDSLVVNLGTFRLMVPTDINDAGYIAGYGRRADGDVLGFILSPIIEVPEPPSTLLLVVGLLLLLGKRLANTC